MPSSGALGTLSQAQVYDGLWTARFALEGVGLVPLTSRHYARSTRAPEARSGTSEAGRVCLVRLGLGEETG